MSSIFTVENMNIVLGVFIAVSLAVLAVNSVNWITCLWCRLIGLPPK